MQPRTPSAGPAALRADLAAALPRSARSWLDTAVAAVAAEPAAIRRLFPAAGRHVGRGPLPASGDARAGGTPAPWRVDDAARVLLLVALGDDLAGELAELYRFGDTGEQLALLRALPLLPAGAPGLATAGADLVRAALRSHDARLVAAALGPCAGRYLDDAGFRHGVLTCAFLGIPVAVAHDLSARADAELARMLAAFVHERVAAGRSAPADVWPIIDRFPPGPEIAAVTAALTAPGDAVRRAAGAALAARAAARAIGPATGSETETDTAGDDECASSSPTPT
jgi:hypothetical protein